MVTLDPEGDVTCCSADARDINDSCSVEVACVARSEFMGALRCRVSGRVLIYPRVYCCRRAHSCDRCAVAAEVEASRGRAEVVRAASGCYGGYPVLESGGSYAEAV